MRQARTPFTDEMSCVANHPCDKVSWLYTSSSTHARQSFRLTRWPARLPPLHSTTEQRQCERCGHEKTALKASSSGPGAV